MMRRRFKYALATLVVAMILSFPHGVARAQKAAPKPAQPIPPPAVLRGKAIRVPLTVKDWVNVNHIRSPVTSGIPLPLGEIKSADQLQIVTAGGKQTPAQFRALAWWPDKSIRWVLCDFQADVKAGGSSRYYLVSKPARKSRSLLNLQETKQAITVDTGAMRFRVSRSRQSLVEQVTLAGRPLSAGAESKDIGFIVSDAAGKKYQSAVEPPRSVVVEEKGPMRVVVKVDGTLKLPGGRPGPSYTARIHAYGGKSFLRVHLVLKNHGGNLGFADLRLRTRLAATGKLSYAFGSADKPHKGSLAKGERRALDHTGKITDSAKQLASLKGPAHWCDLSGPAGGVTTAMMYFRENAPKALEVAGDGVADVVLLPRQKNRKSHSFRAGLHKTHELFYYFHRPGARDADLRDTVAALRYPLHATAPATWYRDTMAVPGMFLAVSDPQRWARYERSVSGYNGWKPGRSPVGHGLDRQGIGHWSRFGVKGWDDIDNPYGEVIQYMRCSNHPRGPLEAAKIFTRGSIDAKLMHRSGSHVYQCNYGAWQFEHFGIQGWLIYYCLTGEAYAMEGARELAEGLRIRLPGWSQRAQGRAIKAFVSLFEITGEQGYLDSAAQIVRRYRGGQGVRGEVWSLHAFVWQLAFIADGAGRYCLAARLAGRQDRAAEKFLTDLLDFFTENCWEPRRNKDGSPRADGDGAISYYWYAGGVPSNYGSDGKGGDQSFLFANGYACGYLLTGRKKYWQMAVKTGRNFRCTGNKNFHWRQGQAYLAQVQGLSVERVYPDKDPPAAVKGLHAAWASNYDVGLRWKQAGDNHGVAAYRVYRGSAADFGPAKHNLVAMPSAEQFVDRKVTEGAKYYYKVTAVDGAGNEGLAGKALAVAIPADVPPLMTATLAAAPRTKSILLLWKARQSEADVVGVNVYRSARLHGGFQKIPVRRAGAVGVTSYYLDSAVEMGKRYYYRIRQVDRGGLESVFSNVACAGPAEKTKPVTIRINLGGKQYTDKQGRPWQADAPASAYKLLGRADATTTSKDIKGTDDDPLFQTARLSSKNAPNATFRFELPNGKCKVTLLFGGIVRPQVTSNIFDVYVNGDKALAGVDPSKDAGPFTAGRKEIHDVIVLDGKLDVEFWCRAGRYEISGIAIEGEGQPAPAAAAAAPAKTARTTVIAINCGGGQLTDSEGVQWSADQMFNKTWGYLGNYVLTGKSPRKPHTSVYQSFLTPGPLHVATIKPVPLPGFGPPRGELRTTLISGKKLAYRIKVPNGKYRLRLHFVKERGGGRTLNRRVGFDIVVEKRRAWQDLDMFWVRAAKEFIKTFDGVTVSDGDLTVELLSNFGYPYPPRLCGMTLEKLVDRRN